MIACYGSVSHEDLIRNGEFYWSPNRLNVSFTRARKKLVVLLSSCVHATHTTAASLESPTNHPTAHTPFCRIPGRHPVRSIDCLNPTIRTPSTHHSPTWRATTTTINRCLLDPQAVPADCPKAAEALFYLRDFVQHARDHEFGDVMELNGANQPRWLWNMRQHFCELLDRRGGDDERREQQRMRRT